MHSTSTNGPDALVQSSPQGAQALVDYEWPMGSVLIDSNPPGAEVSDGGAVLGKTPLRRSLVLVGSHHYSLSYPEFLPSEVSGDVEATRRLRSRPL